MGAAVGVLCLAGLTGVGAASAAPAAAGMVLGWGGDNAGQVGGVSSTPIRTHVPAGTRITAVAAGSDHSLALTSDGRVLAWGDNHGGQYGNGGYPTSGSTPVQAALPAGTDVTAIAAGAYDSLVLTSDGRVLAWGFNNTGALGNGTTTSSAVPVPVDLPAGTKVTAIAAGSGYSLAVTSAGSLLAWGTTIAANLGFGGTGESLVPVQVPLPAGVTVTASPRAGASAWR